MENLKFNAIKELGGEYVQFFLSTDGEVTYLEGSMTFTEQEIQAKMVEMQQAWDKSQYQRLRQDEYPTIEQQLDMQYWDYINGTTLWVDLISEIKNKYQK